MYSTVPGDHNTDQQTLAGDKMTEESQLLANRYQLGSLLGQGGMGVVYQGVDTQTNQPVAVKVLRPEVVTQDPDFLERFDREAEALRKLNHPNIVSILARIEENNQHYIVLEYVSGGSLADLLHRDGQLPVEQVLNIALDISDALTRAHRLHIIHRDIKPANIILAEDGTPRLSDFGHAQLGDHSRVTESGSIIGTYGYLSPEICMGEDVDARTDIWSFGVLLYEMLAGRRPYDAPQPAAILTAILTKPVPDLLQFRPDCPLSLLGLVYWMLEKDREKRTPSVRIVGAQLEAILSGSDTPIVAAGGQHGYDSVTPAPPTPTASITAGLDFSFVEQHTPTPGTGEADMDGPTLPVTPSPIPPPTTEPEDRTPTAPPMSRPQPSSFVRRQVTGAPRIFISYRREDSIAVTGRLYDRLVAAFGETYIFKDVDNIPIGANFKAMLEQEVTSCDVLLAVIGQQWEALHSETGQRRIENPDDFVRIEISAGLQRPDILVIPVLVNNAKMPEIVDLPKSMADLAYRNAAVIRNDPDFNRDTAWLIEQIKRDFDIVPEKKPFALPWRWLAGVAALLVALVVALVALPGLLQKPTSTVEDKPLTVSVAPVKAGEYMVLVAQPEHLGGEERDVGRFIADDLRRNLEEVISFSPLRIRSIPTVITSAGQAQQIAEDAGATVIIWGNYDASRVEVNIQIGTLAAFPYNAFSRDELEKIANVRVQLSDERRQSVAMPVLATLQVLFSADGDGMGVGRNSALGGLVTVEDGILQGSGVETRWSQAVIAFMRDDNAGASDAINQLLALDASNANGYLARGLIMQKIGDFDPASDDVYTAQRLGPPGWTSPLMMLGNDALYLRDNPAAALPFFTDFITARPDDPNGYTFRGMAYYVKGDYASARTDFEQAIELDSTFNFPYFMAAALDLRDARLADAQELNRTILRLFPDPTSAELLLRSAYGQSVNTELIPLVRAFGHMILGQWRSVIADVNAATEDDIESPELYLIQGFAECNLKNYADAEVAYTAVINLDPTFILTYGLRAEVRLRQSNTLGALADVGLILESDQAAQYAPLIPLIQSGELTCENFFTYDLSQVETVVPATAQPIVVQNTTAPTIPPTATPTPTVTVSPTPEPVATISPTPRFQVEPVAVDEWLVLVSELEPLTGKADANITRFIVRDLTRKLEEDIPFSRVRVRQTEQVIRSDNEARQAGRETGAAVVVWGNYSQDLIEIEVQVGSTASFSIPETLRPTLERTANITLHLSDTRRQSVVIPVLGVLGMLQSADGNAYEVLRTLAIIDQITGTLADNDHPEMIGSGVSTLVHADLQTPINDPSAALAFINQAIQLDPGNPLLYMNRSNIYLRLGELDNAVRDADSSERRGSPGWPMPLYIRASAALLRDDLDTALTYYDQIIAKRPAEWFPFNMRASLEYLKQDYEASKADFEQAFALQPDTNFPYIISALIALREGRMADARHYLDTVLTEFPDPAFSTRIAVAAFGEQNDVIFSPMFAAIGNFILEQYDQMLVDTQTALAIDDQLTDLYAMEGFAYCNLGQYAEAEAAYTTAIDLEPDQPFVYVLRADSRLKQLNLLGANDDANAARERIEKLGMGEELIAYIDAGLRLEVGCANFFDWIPPDEAD
ncbi:MAG: protein kinase [Anaerolineaceae bacterium]|nr:protein kinase [Anaerolineaceae bacterium]